MDVASLHRRLRHLPAPVIDAGLAVALAAAIAVAVSVAPEQDGPLARSPTRWG